MLPDRTQQPLPLVAQHDDEPIDRLCPGIDPNKFPSADRARSFTEEMTRIPTELGAGMKPGIVFPE